MAAKKDQTPPDNDSDTPSGGQDGEAAWTRLKAATKPLPKAKKNRHLDASPGTAGGKTKAKTKTSSATKAAAAHINTPKSSAHSAAPAKPKPPPHPGLPQKAKRRLARGHIEIEARLDLHGHTLAEAHRSLIGFVSSAAAQQKKWLLVITGKGVRGEGKLRRALHDWVAAPPLAAQIAEYGPAAPNHGGDGAFYVRLRRAAKP